MRLPIAPGALAGVSRLLSDERVNILAMALDSAGQLRLVLDNHVHGAGVLREHHHQVTERDVIVTTIANAPGALAPTLRLVADASVNVEYAYGGAAEGSAMASVVLGVDDAQRASAAAGTGASREVCIVLVFGPYEAYVEPMDVVVVDVDRDGRVRLETDEWIAPTLQEKRAILYAAQQSAALTEPWTR